MNCLHHPKYKPISSAQGLFICVIITLSHQWHGSGFVSVSGFILCSSINTSVLANNTHLCTLCMTLNWRQRKEMFAMRGNPYLNTPLHRAKGIKNLILIQAVFDVLDGELPRDFTAGWITLSLAVDRIYPPGASRSGPSVYILHVCASARAFKCTQVQIL